MNLRWPGLSFIVLSLGAALIWPWTNSLTRVDTLPNLTQSLIVARKAPVFIRTPGSFAAKLSAIGLNGFESWRQSHGEDVIYSGEDSDYDSKVRRMNSGTVSAYVEALFKHQEELTGDRGHPSSRNMNKLYSLRLSETWGSRWLAVRPNLSRALSALYEPLVPNGFSESLQVKNLDEQSFVLWAAPAGYEYSLHADLVSGTLLTHLDGQKTVWLYPPSQAAYLYLDLNDREDNWELNSPVNPVKPDFMRFPKFAFARPLILNLNKGDVLFIPCGWPHFIVYPESAMSLGVNLFPDWLHEMEKNCSELGKEFVPRSCSDLLTRPVGPVRC